MAHDCFDTHPGAIARGIANRPFGPERSHHPDATLPPGVDAVRRQDLRGPHHIRSRGDCGAIPAFGGAPVFDGFAEGWYVSGAGTRNRPTAPDGYAHAIYLLPGGAIGFTAK